MSPGELCIPWEPPGWKTGTGHGSIQSMTAYRREKSGPCELCGRQRPLTFHHLIPRKLHRRVQFRKHYPRSELSRGLLICRLCHKGVHEQHDEMTLARRYSSLDALRDDSVLGKHMAWAARQKIQ